MIYCRISDDRTGQAAGVKRQEDDTRALCRSKGWEVIGVHVDNDISASRYSRKVRPAYTEVLAMAQRGELDVIACYDVDRLYRRPAELEDLIDLAEQVTIASVQGDLRLDSSDGRAVARVLAAMSAKSSDDTSRRVKRKHLATAEAGMPAIGRRRPFGFERDAISHRPIEAARIREAAARILGGDSLSAICRDWTAAGVMTPDGNQWQTSALRRMLTSHRMVAVRAIRDVPVGPAVWEPILERVTWEAMRSTLEQRNVPGGASPGGRSYLLSGLIFCEACGAAMGAAPLTVNGKRYRRYFCQARRGGCNRVGINADRCEADIRDGFIEYAQKEGQIQRATPIDLTDAAMSELLRIESDLAELAALLGSGGMAVAAYDAATRSLTARADVLRAQLADTYCDGDMEAIGSAVDPVDVWDRMPFDRKRAVLSRVLVRVDIGPSSGRGAGYEHARVHPVWRAI